jgi:hypothetical protein
MTPIEQCKHTNEANHEDPIVVRTQITSREIFEWMQTSKELAGEVHELVVKIKGNGVKGIDDRLADVEKWITRANQVIVFIGVPLALAAVFFIAGVLTHKIVITF